MRGPIELFRRKVGDIMHPARVRVTPETTCSDVARRLIEHGQRFAVITDERRIRGVIGSDDLLPILAGNLPTTTPVRECLPAGAPVMVRRGTTLYRALGLLQARQRPAAAVVTPDGLLCGVIHVEDCLRTGCGGITADLEALVASGNATALATARRGQPALIHKLLSNGADGRALQQVVGRLNDDLHRDITTLAQDSMDQDGWGSPPYPFALILMGSAGRRESFLDPDQDNGLVIADYPDSEHGSVDRYFSELAARITRMLDQCGIPLCPGNVMATNPLWRKTLSQWREQVRTWLRRRSPQGFLNSNILLDCRGVAGDTALSRAMRADLIGQLSSSASFVRSLTLNDSIRDVGLDWLDRLVTDAEGSSHAGETDLKRHGIMPIVEVARLYSLAQGLEATSTPERLDALEAAGAVSADDAAALKEAHAFMATLLFRHQMREWEAGRPLDKHLAPEALNRGEREGLIRSLKTSRSMVRQLTRDLVGSVDVA